MHIIKLAIRVAGSSESAQVPGAEHQSTVLGDAPTAGILIKQGVRADLHYNPSTPSSRTTGAQYTSTIGAHSLPRSYRHFCRHTYHLIIFPHYRFKSAGLSAVDRRAGCGGGFLAIFRGRDRRSRLKWGGLSGVSLPGANLSSNVAWLRTVWNCGGVKLAPEMTGLICMLVWNHAGRQPIQGGWLMCRAIRAPLDRRPNPRLPPTPTTPLSLTWKPISQIANVFFRFIFQSEKSHHPNIFISISKINYTFYFIQTKWYRRYRYPGESKTKTSIFIINAHNPI